ncbi:MAG: SEC-C domain-containing protein [Bacteroidales bacterium]|nr:SEC-C domain-containing protein [Bacteroidales bacterium]
MPGKDIIFKALESFPKLELEDIRHYFGAELPSRVRKSELVERLGAYIVERPDAWLGKMLERDLRLLKKLVEAGPEVPVYLEYPDFPSVLETVKLLGSDTSDENFRCVWIPKEMYDIVAGHIDEALHAGEEDGTFEMERAALGYLNLYGVMTIDEFYDKMVDYCEWSGRWSVEDFAMKLSGSPVMKLCRLDIGGEPYVCAPNIFEPEEIVTGRKEYPGVEEFKPFTPEDAIKAGAGSPYFVFGLDTPEGLRLVEMLDNLGYSGEDLVHEEHDIWMNAQMVGGDDSTEAIFSSVSRMQDKIDSFEDYNACMEVVSAYANSLPKWLLRGHSADEVNCLKVILQSEEDPVTAMIRRNPLLGLYVRPVPADDPCPCGSGLSYRFCHGRRLS